MIKYNIDKLEINGTLLVLSGWVNCHEDKACMIINIDGIDYSQDIHLYERPDVYDFFKKEVNLNTGFDITLNIPKKNKYGIKVYVKDNGKKVCLYDKNVTNSGLINSIVCNLDAIQYGNSMSEINIRGWVFSTLDSEPVTITAAVNNKQYAIEGGKHRYDVQKAYSNYEYSNKSGFYGQIISKKPITSLKITYTSKSGAVKTIQYKVADYCNAACFKEKTGIQKAVLFKSILGKTIGKVFDEVKNNKEKLTFEYLHTNYKSMMNEYNRKKSSESLADILDIISVENVWEENNSLSKDLIEDLLSSIKEPVTYTIFLFATDKKMLERSIASIEQQVYKNYKLYIVNTKTYSAKLNAQYNIINISELNKILSEQKIITNTILMQDNCQLRKEAFLLLNYHLQSDGSIYYTDSNINKNLFFKPDWSHQHILSNNYIGNFIVINNIADWKNQFIDEKYDTALLYNFILQASFNEYSFKHIPFVYFDETVNDKNINYQDYINAVSSYLKESGIKADVVLKEAQKDMYPLLKLVFDNTGPDVEIIIPTKNQCNILKECVTSLLKTSYKNYTVTVIDNESDDEKTIAYLNEISKNDKIKIFPVKNKEKGVFSYSYVNNQAVLNSKAGYVLFLNNDTEIINQDWLSSMMGYMQFKNAGIVGAKLKFSDDSIQHAGLVMGLNDGMVAPAFKLLPKNQKSYMNYSQTTRNYSAVTAACLLIRKDIFMKAGMFDDDVFSVAYNDVDLCLKVLSEQKKEIIYAAEAELYHYEGVSRGYVDKIDETLAFKEKYYKFYDGFYNPNLSLANEWFQIDTSNHMYLPDFKLKKRRIAGISHNLNLEGAPLQLFDIFNGLNKKYSDFEFEIWSPLDGPLKNIIEDSGIKVRIVNISSGRNLPTEINIDEEYQRKYINLLKENNIHGVIANTLESFYAVNYASEAGIPSIWLIHESVDYERYFDYISHAMQEKFIHAFGKAYKLLFVADATKELYRRVDCRHSSYTIHNSIKTDEIEQYKNNWSKQDVREKLSIDKNKIIGVMVGTVCERKGQKDIVYAVQKLKEKYPNDDVCIYIVGGRKNEYTDEIKSLIQEYCLEDSIKIIMETKDVFPYYRASDYLVFTSYNESYPRVMIEAMLFDLPVITTNVYGIKEQIFEGINGFLFNPGDIESFVEKIHKLISDKELLEKYTQNSAKTAKYLNNYDWMIEKYYKLLYQMFFVNYTK